MINLKGADYKLKKKRIRFKNSEGWIIETEYVCEEVIDKLPWQVQGKSTLTHQDWDTRVTMESIELIRQGTVYAGS